jgi:hypothetical protein
LFLYGNLENSRFNAPGISHIYVILRRITLPDCQHQQGFDENMRGIAAPDLLQCSFVSAPWASEATQPPFGPTMTEESKEVVRAFMEKRKPNFRG